MREVEGPPVNPARPCVSLTLLLVCLAHARTAFADAVQKGASFPTTADDGVRNMAVLDAVYTKAGLPVRGTPV